MSSERIAFVGVGRMGANMARRLKDCGYAVTAVYDVHAASADALAAEIGAKSARTLAEVTAAADVIFTVVTDDAAQLGVFGEKGDSLLIGAKGRAFVNCATITPAIPPDSWAATCCARRVLPAPPAPVMVTKR